MLTSVATDQALNDFYGHWATLNLIVENNWLYTFRCEKRIML